MGAGAGQAEVVHRGLSVYVVSRKLVHTPSSRQERSGVDDVVFPLPLSDHGRFAPSSVHTVRKPFAKFTRDDVNPSKP